MGRNYGPSSISISPYCTLPGPCLHRHLGRADAGSKTWRHPHGRMSAQHPHNAPHPLLLDDTPQLRPLDDALQLRQHNRTHHRKKRRSNELAPNPNGDGLTAKMAKAWARKRAGQSKQNLRRDLGVAMSQSGFTGDTIRGKGALTPDNVVMSYPEIPDVAHEFAACLQFGILRAHGVSGEPTDQALTTHGQRTCRNADDPVRPSRHSLREDERALGKIGRMRTVDAGHIGIGLPPLNMSFVKVHRELATVRNGAKDMVTKNKRAKKAKMYVHQHSTRLTKRSWT